MSLKIVIACGGTGGHLFPGIAVAEELQDRGHEVLCLISQKEVDALATRGYDHLRFETVPAVGMPRLLSPAGVRFLIRFWKTVRRCRTLLDDFRADAVMGMGGFTSMPPVLAGKRRAKTFVHESNAFPGKANRFTARFCDVVLLGFEECAQHFPGRRTEIVGTPVRKDLRGGTDKAGARKKFGLDPGRKTLLVMGGSQGARGVNQAVCDALPHLDAGEIQILHLTGVGEHDTVQRAYKDCLLAHHVAPFCPEMGAAYTAADLVVSRAGASSLAELAFFRIPAILVPYPFAADDHQMRNGEVFSKKKAVLLIEEKHLTGKSLSKMINDLLASPDCLKGLSDNLAPFAPEGAAGRIGEMIEATCAR